MNYRPLADTGIQVSEIALGCWPIAGMTSPGVNDADSIATIRACFDLGINLLDTAHMYGRTGESERLIARALGSRRQEMVIATKCGLRLEARGQADHDARPATLRRQCEESLRRLGTDHVELLYLHAPDKDVPVAESAGEPAAVDGGGKDPGGGGIERRRWRSSRSSRPRARWPLSAPVQHAHAADRGRHACPGAASTAWRCWSTGRCEGLCWPARSRRDYVFGPDDSRHKYPMFLGEERQKNHDLVDRLAVIAEPRATRGRTGR